MKNNYLVSKMLISDIDEILNLQLKNSNYLLSEHSIREDFVNGPIYFICKENSKVIGYIAAKALYDHIDILAVLVDDNYKKRGVASLLLYELIKYSKENRFTEIFLEVRSSNNAAQKLYEKFNFQKISIRSKYYEDNLEDAFIYKLDI